MDNRNTTCQNCLSVSVGLSHADSFGRYQLSSKISANNWSNYCHNNQSNQCNFNDSIFLFIIFIETAGPTDLSVNKSSASTGTSVGTGTMSVTPSTTIGGGYMSSAGFRSLSSTTSTTTVNNRRISSNNSSSATGMLQLFPAMNTTSSISSGTTTLPLQPSMLNQTTPPTQPSSKLLNKADVVTVRQLIAGYRESAAFLLRSADELEHLLLLRG